MRAETARPIIELLLDHLDAGRSWTTEGATVAAADYADPAHLAREWATVLRRLPQAVALTPDLPEPRSHVTTDSLPLPVVLTRSEGGEVHALTNVCAHRGSQVVADGRGRSRRLTCPYHAWSYGLDGTLMAVPDRAAFPDLETPGPGLQRLPVIEDGGIIWVSPSPGGGSPEPRLGGIADDLATFAIAEHERWRSHRFDLALNWKLVVDTFLEGYHFSSLHRDTVGPVFLPNLCHAERFGRHLREVLPRRSLEQLRDQPPESWELVPHSALVYVLFPTTVFVMQVDHIETWRIVPDATDPGRSRCDLTFYVPRGATSGPAERHWENNWRLTLDTVIHEDFAAMAGVQRGLSSGAIDHLTVGANEPALGMFHAALAEAMDDGAD